jgi:hypothetical protein
MRAGFFLTSCATSLAFAGVIACSSASAPTSPAAAPNAAASADSEVEDLPELTPVIAPENLVAIATLRTPARTLDTAMAWTGLGIDFRTLLQSSGPGAAILPVLNLEAPLDVVATIDPKIKNKPRVLFAASIGLTSRQAALDAFQGLEFPVEFVEPGVHLVRPSAKLVCFVAPALGKASARLVCGEDRESIELLSPYLTRGIPSEGTGDADLHVELRAEAPWRLYGDKTQLLQLGIPMLLGEVSIGNAEFDGALRDGATALVDELILGLGELKDLKLDARLRSDANASDKNELQADLAVAFQGSKSWLARALVDAEGRASAAPPTFWKLPADANQAAYSSTSNPALTQSGVDVLERLFQSGLGHLGASSGVQRSWSAAFKQAMDVRGPIVSARGNIPKESLPATLDAREELRSAIGYAVLGVEDPDNRYTAWFEQTLVLYEDAALRKSMKAKYGLDASKLPKVVSKKGPAGLANARTYELSLPAALFAEALEEKGVDVSKLAPIPIVVVTSRDAGYTWFGVSSYGSVLERKLATTLAKGGPEGTLQGRAGLERLHSDPGNVAGFWTLGGLASGRDLTNGDLGKWLAPLADNQVPIVGRAVGQSAGPTSLLQVHVPAQLFRDVAMAAVRR